MAVTNGLAYRKLDLKSFKRLNLRHFNSFHFDLTLSQYKKWTIYVYIPTHMYMPTCMYVYIYTHMYTYIYIYIYIHTCIHTYTYIYIYTHTCIHTYTYICCENFIKFSYRFSGNSKIRPCELCRRV